MAEVRKRVKTDHFESGETRCLRQPNFQPALDKTADSFRQDLMIAVRMELERLADPDHAAFMARLAPTITQNRFLGVRMPFIRQLARSLSLVQKKEFLAGADHRYYEEDLLHIELMNQIKDPRCARLALEHFVRNVNSWALTDGMTFPKLADEVLLEWAEDYRGRADSYQRRLAILWIMKRIFRPSFSRKDRQFWMNMALMIHGGQKELTDAKGWLLCEGLIHDPVLTWPYFLDETVALAVRKKGIQKSTESRRIDMETKARLKDLRKQLKAAG